jgi:hypothetical protein
MIRLTFKGETAVVVNEHTVSHFYQFEVVKQFPPNRVEFAIELKVDDEGVILDTIITHNDPDQVGAYVVQAKEVARYTYQLLHQQTNPYIWV